VKSSVILFIVIAVLAALPLFAGANEIFDDEDDALRFASMNKCADVILKSISEIGQLTVTAKPDQSRIDSQIALKSQQADEIINICSHYFLCQRISLPFASKREDALDRYREQLDSIHQLMRAAMRCKQVNDVQNVETLKSLISSFAEAYRSK